MFSWIKSNCGRNQQVRRTFRPGADQLESREVLSAFTTLRAIAPPHPAPSLNILTRGLSAANLYGNQNSLGTVGKTLTNLPGIVSSVIAQNATTGTTTARTVSTTPTTTTTGRLNTNIPRLGGFQNNVNTNAALTSALNAARSFLSTAPTINLAQNNLAGVTNFLGQRNLNAGNSVLNGLAFTSGTGFGIPSAGSNAATNGLAFTNNTGFGAPARAVGTTSTATNGLAFTNNTGFSVPSNRSNTSTNGLAFTQGTGLSVPSVSAGTANATSNGLAFTGNTGFSVPSRTVTSTIGTGLPGLGVSTINTGLPGTGLGNGTITIGNSGVMAGPSMFL